MKTEKWYQRRLEKYFDDYYNEFEDYAEWFANPAENTWIFDLDGYRITLTCDNNGEVHESRRRLKGVAMK